MAFGVCPICACGEEEICFSNRLGLVCCLTCHHGEQAERAGSTQNARRLSRLRRIPKRSAILIERLGTEGICIESNA